MTVTRRELITYGIGSAATAALGCGDDGGNVEADAGMSIDGGTENECTPTPPQTAGPFYFDPMLERVAIDEGRAGVRLEVAIEVVAASDCNALEGAVVDLWHADAGGLYSGYPGQGDNGDIDTQGETFCRGVQITDDVGRVMFETIYPGWYPGRTIHCHFTVRADVGGANREATGQFYFSDDTTDAVFMEPPYDSRPNRAVRNANDGIAGNPAANGTLADLEAIGAGYRATFRIVV